MEAIWQLSPVPQFKMLACLSNIVDMPIVIGWKSVKYDIELLTKQKKNKKVDHTV
jgi:hypothetical protein